MALTVYKKHNYTRKDINYIKNTPIIEYDMTNAGINILFTHGLLSEEFVTRLNKMPKLEKNITVGKILQNNPEWNKIMMDEFVKIRYYFMLWNNLTDDDILSIKKDAIFIINKKVNKLKLSNNYEFKAKGHYDTYLNLRGKEFYVNIEDSSYDVKGFSKDVLKVQSEYFIEFILTALVLDKNDRFELFEHMKEFREQFLTFKLEPNYYFDLDEGGYLYRYSDKSSVEFSTSFPPKPLSLCNIDNNYKYFFELINILLV